MRLISGTTIDAMAMRHPAAGPGLRNIRSIMRQAKWTCMNDITSAAPGHPSPVSASRVVFNINHNNFRLIVDLHFPSQAIWVKWFGTHAEYDCIDPASAENYGDF